MRTREKGKRNWLVREHNCVKSYFCCCDKYLRETIWKEWSVLLLAVFFFFLTVLEFELRSLAFARQALCHLNHIHSHLCFSLFFRQFSLLPWVSLGPWLFYLCLLCSWDCRYASWRFQSMASCLCCFWAVVSRTSSGKAYDLAYFKVTGKQRGAGSGQGKICPLKACPSDQLPPTRSHFPQCYHFPIVYSDFLIISGLSHWLCQRPSWSNHLWKHHHRVTQRCALLIS
jgi:hypothetical protein